jgi:arylsulfatase A-like enzyme
MFIPDRQYFSVRSEKNVLFLIVDDLNTWLISNPDRYTGKVIAPNIKGLAESGVNFTQAFTASPKCSPSRAAFLSGVAPWVSGIYENSQDQQASPALQNVTNLIKYFKDNGYYTAGGGKINHGYKLGDAWSEYIDDHHTTRDRPYPMTPEGTSLNGWDTYGKEADWGLIDDPNNVNSRTEEEMMDTYAASFAVNQVNKASGNEPFFIVCGLFHPHMPWHVPQKYLDMYPLEEITPPEIIPNDFDDIPEIAHQYGPVVTWKRIQDGGISLWKEAIQGYLASTSYADAQMGRVLKALKDNGLEDNTIVVLLSDYGFHLGEKEHWQKSTLWEEATNSLFMFRAPGVTNPGGICNRTVSFLDLYPTLVDLAGLPDPGHFNPAYQRSLTPLLKDPSASWPHPAITAYDMEMSVRIEKYRYIRYTDGSVELYNRDEDPHEWTNLAVDTEYMDREDRSPWKAIFRNLRTWNHLIGRDLNTH